MKKKRLVVPICVSDVPIICRYNEHESISEVFVKVYDKIRYNKANMMSMLDEDDEDDKDIFDSYVIINAIDTLMRGSLNGSNNELIERLYLAREDIFSQEFHSDINRMIGSKYEQLAIDFYESITGKQVVSRNDKLHTRVYHVDDISLYISGRVDGIQTDGAIVEVKTRRYQLSDHPLEKDLAQIESYMFLLGCAQAILIQQHIKDNKRGVAYRFTKVKHNRFLWERGILADLVCFSRAMKKFIENKHIRDEFFKYNDNTYREKIILNLMFSTNTQRYC